MSALPAPKVLPLRAFEGYGIEIEYMVVHSDSLSVFPIVDQLVRSGAEQENSLRGLGWSNELVSHVIELKNVFPTASLRSLRDQLQHEIRMMNRRLSTAGGCLMPTAMHPWMDSLKETKLWAHGEAEIYNAYDRIFNCRSHGWANLQSLHINLPFENDEAFARLHAAVRLVLPILPAIAASSPIADGVPTGYMDYRLETYRHNAVSIPSITGKVIPETVSTKKEYESLILAPMYQEIAPFDPDRLLQYEWLNSRGAIARFDRNAIEIRLVDVQECPYADIAIAGVVIDLIKMLYAEYRVPLGVQQSIKTDALANILLASVREGDNAIIDDPDYLAIFGYRGNRCRAAALWKHITQDLITTVDHSAIWHESLSTILRHGPLARRILQAVASECTSAQLHAVYRTLCKCLEEGRMFVPEKSSALMTEAQSEL